jgi:SAM-dependent methyltransferase
VPVSYRGRTYQEGKKSTWKDGVKALFIILYYKVIDDLYDENYDHAILHSLSSTHRFNRWMADTIKPWVGKHVLEIGAGLGNLTQKLLPRESYVASDIDPIYLQYLPNLFEMNRRVSVAKLNVEQAADFSSFQDRFDTVVCLNVIEHVEKDVQAMRNILGSLKSGGRACILVPRSMKLYGTLDEVLGHFRRYSREELEGKLKEAGFEVEEIFTFNRVTVPAWWWNARVLKRRHFSKIQLKIFDSTVWFWRRFDKLIPWQGISLIAIARKP